MSNKLIIERDDLEFKINKLNEELRFNGGDLTAVEAIRRMKLRLIDLNDEIKNYKKIDVAPTTFIVADAELDVVDNVKHDDPLPETPFIPAGELPSGELPPSELPVVETGKISDDEVILEIVNPAALRDLS